MRPALGGGLRLPAGDPGQVLERREEEGLVDASLEDRDAHLHALGDYVAPLETGLARHLGRREVDSHWHASYGGGGGDGCNVARTTDSEKQIRRTCRFRSVGRRKATCKSPGDDDRPAPRP